jgi:glycosyltransferase involved in cell wall biosynthesis
MGAPRTVLYVQHAATLGGSCVSLRDMLSALDRDRYRPVVALAQPTEELRRYHATGGVETIPWPGIATLEHTTAEWASAGRPMSWARLARAAAGWGRSERRTLELVDRVEPDLVHLNSAVLVPSARALHRAGVPFVWHVREMPVRGHAGVRTRLVREALVRWPSAALFLSEVARRAWVGATPARVVPEFVDLGRFRPGVDRAAARRRLGLAPDAPVVLYVGGMAAIKGILPLLGAIARVREQRPDVVCLMPGAEPALGVAARVASTVLPGVTLTGRIRRAVRQGGLEAACRRMPFSSDMPELLAASDVLAFPSLTDHFARPVVEAGAMARPVVASRFPMIEEQVADRGAAELVPPGDAGALADALARVLRDAERARAMGAAGLAIAAERFDLHRNTAAVMSLYDDVLARSRRAPGRTESTPCA